MAAMTETDGWVVQWPDGTTSEARTSYDLISTLGAQQTEPVNHEDMKDLLSVRAQAWSCRYIHPAQYDPAFLRELARVGLIKIIKEGTK